jgi:glycosyltransferase involved in cell wall biosynthesis
MQNVKLDNIIVSVIMITFGHEKYIKQAVEGVLMQLCDFEIELIVANDCSPDNTDSIVQKIIETHPKSTLINYTKHNLNKGMSSNFIWASEQTKGKYIALCEGDDYWTDPYKLQKQVDFLESNKSVGIVYTNVTRIKQINENEYQINDSTEECTNYLNIENYIKAGSPFINTCTFLMRSVLLSKENLITIQRASIGDLALVLTALKCGLKVSLLDEITAVYRILIHSASHDTNSQKNAIFFLNKLETELMFISNKKLGKEIKTKYYYKYFHEFGVGKLEFNFLKRVEIVMLLFKKKSKIILFKYLFNL